MANFAKGLQEGFNVGYQFGTALNKRRMDEELSRIDPEYKAVMGTGLRVTDAEGNVYEGVGGQLSPQELAAVREAYAKQGYQVDDIGNRYTARSGQGRDIGVYETADAAEPIARRQNYGLMERRAGIFENYGEHDTARALRRDVRDMERMDQAADIAKQELGLKQEHLGLAKAADARAQELHEAQIENANIALRAAKIRESFMQHVREKGLQGVADWQNSLNTDTHSAIEYDKNTGNWIFRRVQKSTGQALPPINLGDSAPRAIYTLSSMLLNGGDEALARFEFDIVKNKEDNRLRERQLDITENYYKGLLRSRAAGGGSSSGAKGVSEQQISRLQAQQAHYSKKYNEARERFELLGAIRNRSPEQEDAYERAYKDMQVLGIRLQSAEDAIDEALGIPQIMAEEPTASSKTPTPAAGLTPIYKRKYTEAEERQRNAEMTHSDPRQKAPLPITSPRSSLGLFGVSPQKAPPAPSSAWKPLDAEAKQKLLAAEEDERKRKQTEKKIAPKSAPKSAPKPAEKPNK